MTMRSIGSSSSGFKLASKAGLSLMNERKQAAHCEPAVSAEHPKEQARREIVSVGLVEHEINRQECSCCAVEHHEFTEFRHAVNREHVDPGPGLFACLQGLVGFYATLLGQVWRPPYSSFWPALDGGAEEQMVKEIRGNEVPNCAELLDRSSRLIVELDG